MQTAIGSVTQAFGTIFDSLQSWLMNQLETAREYAQRVSQFFEIFDIIGDIPTFLNSYMWGPLAVCITVVALIALINHLLGVML